MPGTASPPLRIYATSGSSAEASHQLTRAVFYYINEPILRPADRYTTAPPAFEQFELTQEQLLKFHELNTSPPPVSVKVVQTFRKRIAKD
jgi:hypothetical protein